MDNMADWHVLVYNLEYPRLQHPNHNAAARHSLAATSFRTGIQFHMRNADFEGAVYEVLAGGNDLGLRWCDLDCDLWGDEGTGA
jgi:hypothetical protein